MKTILPNKVANLQVSNATTWFIRFIESRLFIRCVFLYFIAQTTYMALTTRLGIAPDEIYHYDFIELFSSKGWSPFLRDQENYYSLGSVIRTPFYLYHYLLSLPFHFFGGTSHDYIILRMINIAMGCCSLYIIFAISNALSIKPLARNISIFMLSNTLMFVFLSASINYDNLFILLSLLAVYYTIQLWKNFTAVHLTLLLIVLISGCMVKISFLPIGLTIAFVLIIRYIKTPSVLWKCWRSVKSWRTSAILLTLLGILLVPFVKSYALNFLDFRTFTPSCTDVLTTEQCRQSFIFRRSEELDKISTPMATLGNIEYFAAWVRIMSERTFGILGYNSISGFRPMLSAIQVWAFLGIVAIIRHIKKQDVLMIICLAVSGVYIFTLLRQNHSTYQGSGMIGLAVQGRYAFAVLPLVYVIANHFILKMFNKQLLQSAYILITILIFTAASLPTFVHKTDDKWRDQPADTNTEQIAPAG